MNAQVCPKKEDKIKGEKITCACPEKKRITTNEKHATTTTST